MPSISTLVCPRAVSRPADEAAKELCINNSSVIPVPHAYGLSRLFAQRCKVKPYKGLQTFTVYNFRSYSANTYTQ